MRRLAGWVLIALLFSLSGSACNSAKTGVGGGAAGTKSGKLRFAVIPKGTSHQFWQSVHAGAEAGAVEVGNVEILWKGPESEGDTAGQINVVRNFVTGGVDGIVLAPNHSQALMAAVTEANAQNIPVAIFDSGLGEGPSIVSYVATDNFRGGMLAAERLAESINHKGKVILLRYKSGSESTEQREAGFLEAMAKEKEIEVISSNQYAGTTPEEAMGKATQLLDKYRDEVNGIFAVCEPNCNGTLEALKQSGLAGKVQFVAFDPSESLIAGLSDKSVAGIVLQDPFEMGRQSVIALSKHIKGEKVDAKISTGEYVATGDNKDTPPFDRLLKPKLFGQ